MSVADYPDLDERFHAAAEAYGRSADTAEDRRRYYVERDACFEEAEHRDEITARLRELRKRTEESA